MFERQKTCSLGGITWTHFTLFHSYNFYCRFPENDCSFDGLLTLLRESGRHSKSSVKAVAIFLFLSFKAAVDTLTMNIFIRQNIGRGTTFKILKSRAVQSRFRQNLADVLENDQSAL